MAEADRLNVTKVQDFLDTLPAKREEKVTKVQPKWFMRAGFVYLVRHGESDLFKIGISRCQPKDRLGAMQTGNPIELSMVGVWPVMDAETVEALAHKLCGQHLIRGEWFQLSSYKVQDLLKLLVMEANYYERRLVALSALDLCHIGDMPRVVINDEHSPDNESPVDEQGVIHANA